MARLVGILLTLLAIKAASSAKCTKSPNIVFMLADDLGWGDVQRHDPNMVTPVLDRLAKYGRELYYHYALPLCVPTRAGLLTGVYPYRYGFQANAVKWLSPTSLNTSYTLLPQFLKDAGYDTHMVGKWHLGFCSWSVTPLQRGFDTFYGFLSGSQGFFNHSGSKDWQYDFRDQYELVDKASVMGKFATKLHTDRAVEIIEKKNSSSKPFFLYMSFQSVHNPWEVYDYWENLCVNEENSTRKLFCGMVAAMDRSVGRIQKAVNDLRERQPDRCTLVIFISDNGGDVLGGASNYPLRGEKGGLFEGGTRSYGVVSGPGLLTGPKDTPYKGLMHVVDWVPTLIEAAGGTVPEGLDGVPLWEEIRDNKVNSRSRSSFIYNIVGKKAALRYKNFKLTKGFPSTSSPGWYPPQSMWNDTVFWDEGSPDTLKWEMLFDLEKDPSERVNLLPMLNTLENETYKAEAKSAKQNMTDMLAEEQPKQVQYEQKPKSQEGYALSKQEGAYTPGDWCDDS